MKNGFTLMEVLVAIFLITVGLSATLTLITKTIAFSQIESSKLTAAYLAQEGLEIVKNIRDANYLEKHMGGDVYWNWSNHLSSGSYSNFDYRSQTIPDPDCPGSNSLRFDSTTGFYICCPSTDSDARFQRTITITITPDGNYKLKVLVDVLWTERGNPHHVTAEEELYDWWQ